jgi:uncharacterized membrane protein YbhN (UPF0104 family)
MVEKKSHKRLLILLAKLLLITAALGWVFHKSDTDKIAAYLTQLPWMLFLSALLLLAASQVVSSLRSRFYFKNAGSPFNRHFAIAFYFTGMLFNTVLPGGIGGDGYKIYLIGKLNNMSRLLALKACLSDRASGMFAIMILIALFFPFTSLFQQLDFAIYWLCGYLLVTIIGYFLSIHLFLKERPHTALVAFLYSIPIQLLGGAFIVIALLYSQIGLDPSVIYDYIVLFYISSLMSVIPISIGGAGLRELTYLYGASYFATNAELGVAIAILFFIVNFLCSLSGLLFWHRLELLYRR